MFSGVLINDIPVNQPNLDMFITYGYGNLQNTYVIFMLAYNLQRHVDFTCEMFTCEMFTCQHSPAFLRFIRKTKPTIVWINIR